MKGVTCPEHEKGSEQAHREGDASKLHQLRVDGEGVDQATHESDQRRDENDDHPCILPPELRLNEENR